MFRLINSMVAVVIGPTIEISFFNLGFNGVELIMRYTYGLYFPFIFGAFTLQVLLWVEFSMAMTNLRVRDDPRGKSWLPRYVVVFLLCLFILLVMVIVVETLLVFRYNVQTLLLVYRIFFAIYIGIALIVAIVFAFRILRAVYKKANHVSVNPVASERLRKSRQNLTITILITVFCLLMGLVITLMLAIGRWDGRGQNNEAMSTAWWACIFLERYLSWIVIFPILWAFIGMMRARMQQASGVMSNSMLQSQSTASGSDSQIELKAPLIGRDSESSGGEEDYRASVRSSRVGSLLDEVVDDDESEDGSAFSYKVGDNVWAQHRADGLWYRARVTELGADDEIRVKYNDYEVDDTVSRPNICPDYHGLLSPSSTVQIKAFDSRPSRDRIAEVKASGKLEPDAFGMVGLRGRESRRPNHASLLIKKKTELRRSKKQTIMGKK